MSASPARRTNRGNSHSYTLDGRPVMGVTTIIGKAMPKPALVGWAAREVTQFVASHREILKELGDQELIDLAKGAPYRERDAAANRGTEVHHLAQRLAAGDEIEVPEELTGHVDSYLDFLGTFDPSNAVMERPCFNRRYRYGGTFDMLCSLPNLGAHCLVDIKTNRSGPFGEVALQLAAYGHAEFYVDEEGAEVPMPEIDLYAVAWIRADGFDLYRYDVEERDWKQFLYCVQTANWIDTRMPVVRGEAIYQPRLSIVTGGK